MRVNRRFVLKALGSAPLWIPALPALPACVSKPAEAPLAHLYGKEWVHGAYSLYAEKYAGVQTSSEAASKDAYRVLAQKGVKALGELQSRNVPFFIRVGEGGTGFDVERDVPERLTFTAGMSDDDRAAATARWEKAREHIHHDYEEIHRLDWALTTLLQQLQRLRSAIEVGKGEQYEIVRQLNVLGEGGSPPFALPYQVTNQDYRSILFLLLDRLDDDKARLARIEADIAAVGLVTRATHAWSGSLAANIDKVLLAVVTDADANAARPTAFPRDEATRGSYASHGEAIFGAIRQSSDYLAWEKRERDRIFDQIGSMLSLLDTVTGLKTSVVYKQLLDIWRGDADYLSYLKSAVSFLPFGKELLGVINQAVDLTEKARAVFEEVKGDIEKVRTEAGALKGQLDDGDIGGALLKASKDSGLLNAASDFAIGKLDRQLSFFTDSREVKEVRGLLAETPILKDTIPTDLGDLKKLVPTD